MGRFKILGYYDVISPETTVTVNNNTIAKVTPQQKYLIIFSRYFVDV